MDLEYGQRYEDFRSKVRTFLETHKPEKSDVGLSSTRRKTLIEWLSLQIEQGYWARTIPKEYGGYGAEPNLLETVIMDEEFNRAGMPRGMASQGASMLVPTLLEHGTEEQRQRRIGQRPREPADFRSGGWRRLPDQRPKNLDQYGRQVGYDFHTGAHRA